MPRPRLPSLRPPPGNVLRVELLAGLVVALALIPEAISFSIIAGVDPKVGLYASFTMAVAISITGGRPAMISAATGAMALVVVPLVADHGVEYLFAAAVLAGAIQIGLGALGAAKLMRFVPQSVMTGFVNALAILIFLSQIDHLTGGGVAGYIIAIAGLAIILGLPRLIILLGFPRILPSIPSPLVAIAVLTTIVVVGGIEVPTVGDQGELPSTLPVLGIPSVPFSIDTLLTILPFSLTLAAVGLLESLMTARLVDDITDTAVRQGPRGPRPGHLERRHRLLRRHAGLRNDRTDDDERARIRCAHPPFDLLRRGVPAGVGRRPGRRGRRDPDDRAGRGDDLRRLRHLRLAQHHAHDPATDAGR